MYEYYVFSHFSLFHDDNTKFVISPLSTPGEVEVHCTGSGTESGKYLLVNSNGDLDTGYSANDGELRFVKDPHLTEEHQFTLQRYNHTQYVAFDTNGLPYWSTSINNSHTTLEEVTEIPVLDGDSTTPSVGRNLKELKSITSVEGLSDSKSG